MVARTLVKLSQRVPLIKFRKGGKQYAGAAAGAMTNQASSPASTSKGVRPPAIEDWELPPRYARKPMSDEEMEYINRGGPA